MTDIQTLHMMSMKKASRTKSLSLSDDLPMRASLPKQHPPQPVCPQKRIEDAGKIFKYIDDNIVGKGVAFLGPFGRRKVVYGDFASSGRSLQFLEDYINKEVLPAFGDLNCTSAVTGLQSQLYLKDARDLIRTAVNASPDDDVIFCEGGSILEKLSYLLCNQQLQQHSSATHNDGPILGPVIFVSTTEPDENLRAWIDAGAQIDRIPKNHDGFLDLIVLEKKLGHYVEKKRQMIGLFSGVSRLTGILADDVATTILLHQYGALSIWDYSGAAPFTQIDTNPLLPGAAKDVIFFSSDKFVGGVQAPGVLVIKKSILTKCNTTFEDTVGVVSAVRAGLVVQLKESLGIQTISQRLEKLCKQLLSHIRTIPEIVLLGSQSTTNKRLPTLCFLVRHPRGAFLHHRFVVAVLNDVFGIQATADPFIGEALGISKTMMVDYERILSDDTVEIESLRPGYTKLSLPFFMSESEVGFVLEALKMVATEAWKLLPQYEVNNKTGEWRHHSNSLAKERKWLGSIRYTDGRMVFADRRISGAGTFPQNNPECLQTARNLFNKSRKMAQRAAKSENLSIRLCKDSMEVLRWFMLPGEAHELLLGHYQSVKQRVPFDPFKLEEQRSFYNIYSRHNSLSILDQRHFKSRSVPTSPVQVPLKRQVSSPTPSPVLRAASTTGVIGNVSPPVVRFSLGGEVTTLASLSPPQIANIISNDHVSSRNRCHSWSSSAGISCCQTLSPQQRASLGLAVPLLSTSMSSQSSTSMSPPSACCCSSQQTLSVSPLSQPPSLTIEHATCTCSSQTDLTIGSDQMDGVFVSRSRSPSVNIITSSPNNSSCSLSNTVNSNCIGGPAGSSCSDCVEEIQAYVKEVTKELATEIKSELREVISKVEDVLENTPDLSLNLTSLTNLSSADDLRTDSVSATDVAEYLEEFSKKMASQVKSEIHEIVNQMDQDASAAGTPYMSSSMRPRFSDSQIETKSRTQDVVEVLPVRPNSSPGWPSHSSQAKFVTASSPETSTPACPYTGAISKLSDTNSATSHDSGINLYFHDHEEQRPKVPEREGSFENSSALLRLESVQGGNNKLLGTQQYKNSWQPLPKDVWRQTTEAIDEFNMLKDGDKVLVCLSGSSASMCTLYALRQFARVRGLHIDLGAVSVGAPGVDPRALMLYMHDLDVEYSLEELSTMESLRTKLCTIARRKGYNVLAMGSTMDKLADDFFSSILQKGKIHATQAHSNSREGDIRIIRPFIYVRERLLEDFAKTHNFPTRPSRSFSSPPNPSNSILKVQEMLNPQVYDNIKSALRPLLSFRVEASKSSYEFLRLPLLSRD